MRVPLLQELPLTIPPWFMKPSNCCSDLLRGVGVLLTGLIVASISFASAMASEYRLGPSDKLAVKVVEWQAAEGTFRDWPSIAGEYTVGPNGTLSFPFTGEIQVGGKTTAEVSTEIAKGLQQKLGLIAPP
jgi:polysaccharide biosynthesis/export protein ExoF